MSSRLHHVAHSQLSAYCMTFDPHKTSHAIMSDKDLEGDPGNKAIIYFLPLVCAGVQSGMGVPWLHQREGASVQRCCLQL